MSPSRSFLTVVLVTALAFAGAGALDPSASATAAPAKYTVTVGTKGTWANPDDTPANAYIDKDGTFYYQQSHSLYDAHDERAWGFYSGTDFDTATRDSTISDGVDPDNPNEKNNDTTWRCNNSPTGLEATYAPAGSHYSQKNFCDLAGVWVDPDTGDWYGLIHNEFTPQPFGDHIHFDAIDYAVSTDQGRTWTIKAHVITSPYSTKRGDTKAFPQQTYSYGDGDQRLFVDAASGYFYIYYGSRLVDKGGSWKAFYGHVARAPISAKMAPGSWRKWYNGGWSQSGVGGRESNMVPVDSTNHNGYTPVAREYKPASTGTVDEQVSAGKTPPTSPLFVMDITYNAYLGLYIGEPQAVDQSGSAPQQFYATDNLATQKWRLIGDTGGYTNASWYRWFLDSANRTNSTIVGKDFRSYCSYGCSGDAESEYINVTIESPTPTSSPFDPAKTYRITSGSGRTLAQATGSSATTTLGTPTNSRLAAWVIVSNGDGSYRIGNADTGQLLGVASTSSGDRAWGTRPTVTAVGTGGPTVGQQWFVLTNTHASNGAPTGTYRLVNRYSGLVIGLPSKGTPHPETTPARFWTNTSGNPVGGHRTATDQALSITPVGKARDGLRDAHARAAN